MGIRISSDSLDHQLDHVEIGGSDIEPNDEDQNEDHH